MNCWEYILCSCFWIFAVSQIKVRYSNTNENRSIRRQFPRAAFYASPKIKNMLWKSNFQEQKGNEYWDSIFQRKTLNFILVISILMNALFVVVNQVFGQLLWENEEVNEVKDEYLNHNVCLPQNRISWFWSSKRKIDQRAYVIKCVLI